MVLVVVSVLTKDSLFTINSGTRGLGGGVSLVIGAAFTLVSAAYWQPLQPTGLLGLALFLAALALSLGIMIALRPGIF